MGVCSPVPKYGFHEEKGNFLGLISFAAYLWNRIFHPPGLGLQYAGWYRVYLEIWFSLVALKTMAQESDLSGFN